MSKTETIKKFAMRVLEMDGFEIGTPVILNEVSFVPILKHEIPKEERDYLTLSEAIETGVCNIIDKGTEVAHIVFENLGDMPILIEEGEIFLGQGTQDRICIGTVMVEAGVSQVISVKCVHAPHHLSSGASFGYGGKASRGMLNEMRSMKYSSASGFIGASHISQYKVWNKVSEEMASEKGISDHSQYTLGISARRGRIKKRAKKVTFPKNTVGVVVINNEGEIKGVEIYRSPRNFQVRQEGLFESIESNISWEAKGKGPYKKAIEKTRKMFKEISELEENKSSLNQIEIDGVIIQSHNLKGEAYTTAFYSATCPSCKQPKQRKKICPNCGFIEDASEDLAHMSLF
jgi:hypothetical protein